MDSKFSIALPHWIRNHRVRNISGLAPRLFGLGFALWLLSSCISDGPNQTGGQYLAKHDILLKNPLYHVVLPSFPVDSFWNSDAERNHLGDTILMAGIAGNFTGQVRMAFDLADTSFLDSLSDSAASLRLSVGAVPTTGVGLAELIGTVGDTGLDTTKTYRDSLAFLVETWAVPDRATAGSVQTDAARQDTFNLYNRRFLIHQDTTATLPKPTVLDTIKLQIKGAYAKDNLQAKSLPHLLNFLRSKSTSTKWLIQIQLTPIPDGSKSGLAMLRLGGEITSSYGPALLFGKTNFNPASASSKQKLGTLTTVGIRGVNYTLKYKGSRFDILPAKMRGLHLLLDRSRLLDSLDAALLRQGITPPSRAIQGHFDLTYFIPFGQISLPLADSLTLEGSLPLDMRLASDIDSTLPGTPSGALGLKIIPLDVPTVIGYNYENGNYSKVLDSISLFYRKVPALDSGLNQIIVRFGKDTLKNDSEFVHVGETKEIIIANASGSLPLILTLTAGKNTAQAEYYLSSHAVAENNDFRDEKTGELLSTLSKKLSHLLFPSQKTLNLRATTGLQRLLNRADAGQNVFPDLLIQPAFQSAIDTAVTTGSVTQPQRIPFPILSVIPPKIQGGKLTIGLDLYLYPLKKEL